MDTLLDVENLWVRFPTRQGVFDAVRGVSFTLGRERLGIVGESGSGKSMTGTRNSAPHSPTGNSGGGPYQAG